MNYLHQELNAGPADTIEVVLDSAANVLLMDTLNFEAYKRGDTYRYHGGYVKTSPYRISPPRHGDWHVVVDLGGYGGRVSASIRILSAAQA